MVVVIINLGINFVIDVLYVFFVLGLEEVLFEVLVIWNVNRFCLVIDLVIFVGLNVVCVLLEEIGFLYFILCGVLLVYNSVYVVIFVGKNGLVC